MTPEQVLEENKDKYIIWHGVRYEINKENMDLIVKDWEERSKLSANPKE